MSEILSNVEFIESKLLAAVDYDDDHELFVASYLHGHFDLVVSRVLQQPEAGLSLLDHTMQESLQQAFNDNELTVSDQQRVSILWAKLLEEAKTAI